MEYHITSENPPKASELMKLFVQTNWAKRRSIEGVRSMLAKTEVFIAIHDEEKLIAYGRAITDGIYRALIDDIVVDKDYQKRGLGGKIVSGLLEKLKETEDVFLNTGEHLEGFYKNYGFERADCLTIKL